VVRIAQDADGARLHHHIELEVHGVSQPPFHKCAKDMAVCNLSRFLELQE
jgi:hypothetical protein